MTDIVLASRSPRRRELLAALVDDFAVAVSDVPEPFTGDPMADAVTLACAKAEAVASRCPGAIVIGADTIVFDDERSYGKPLDAGDAAAMLRGLGGRAHRVVSGVAVVMPAGELVTASSCSLVTLRDLDDAEIAASITAGTPMDKAGGYAIQDEALRPVTALDGCYCSVMGLPLWRLRQLLEAAGAEPREPDLAQCAACPERQVK